MSKMMPPPGKDDRDDPHATPIRFLIVQDYKENLRKCTAVALRKLDGFDFIRLSKPRPREEAPELPRGLLLDIDGPVLTPADRPFLAADGRVIVFDASWARVSSLERRVTTCDTNLPRRSLPPSLRTAYPRRSKLFDDPGGGLATVEAIFTVTALLCIPRPEILEGYRWATDFLSLNRQTFQGLTATS